MFKIKKPIILIISLIFISWFFVILLIENPSESHSNDAAISFLIGFSFLLSLTFLFLIAGDLRKKTSNSLEDLTQKRNGEIKRSFFGDRLSFSHLGFDISLYSFYWPTLERNYYYSNIMLKSKFINKDSYKFSLKPTALFNFGSSLKFENQFFNIAYKIKSNDIFLTKNILKEDLQKSLIAFKENDPVIIISSEKIIFKVRGEIIDLEFSNRVIDFYLLLLKRAKEAGFHP